MQKCLISCDPCSPCWLFPFQQLGWCCVTRGDAVLILMMRRRRLSLFGGPCRSGAARRAVIGVVCFLFPSPAEAGAVSPRLTDEGAEHRGVKGSPEDTRGQCRAGTRCKFWTWISPREGDRASPVVSAALPLPRRVLFPTCQPRGDSTSAPSLGLHWILRAEQGCFPCARGSSPGE